MIHDASRLLTAVSGRYNNTVAFQYGDGAGRRTSEALTVNLGQARTYTVGSQYDVVGRLARIVYPDGGLVDRSYTERNQLFEVKYQNALVARFTYDNGGRRVTRLLGDTPGTTTTSTYGRQDNLVTGINTPSVTSFGYSYDANKNKLTETIGGVMASYGFGVPTGGYDAEDRLVGWNRTDGQKNQAWNLSHAGDWNQFTENGAAVDRTHNGVHELTSVGNTPLAYDAKGNLTQDGTKTPAHNYAWDFDNRLKAADVDGQEGSEIGYTYDALGRRVSRSITMGLGTETPTTATTVYVCRVQPLAHSPHAGQEVVEYAAESLPAESLRQYVHAEYIDEPLALIDRTAVGSLPAGQNELFYYHQNSLYCVAALSDQAGAPVERYSYTAYGQVIFHDPTSGAALAPQPAASPLGNPSLYTGRRLDGETGLMYYRARQYSSALGRFLGRDPIGYESELNVYGYVDGAPTMSADPTGMDGATTDYDDFGGSYYEVWSKLPVGQAGKATANFRVQALKGTWTIKSKKDDTCPKPDCTRYFATLVRDVRYYSTNLKIQLPRWTRYAEGTAKEKAAWDTFIAGLGTHEQGHISIYQKFDGTMSITGTGDACVKKDAMVAAQNKWDKASSDEFDRRYKKVKQLSDKYDVDTKHGETQGAVLPEDPHAP